MVINVDAKNGKFIVTCPFHLNHLIRDVPSKRWVGKERHYVVPGSRRAVEALRGFHLTPAAQELCNACDKPPVAPVEFPSSYSFKTAPMPHQRKALDFLWSRTSTALFMGMRTGKSKTTIDWLCALAQEGRCDRAIIVCPLSIRKNWIREFEIHAPINVPLLLLDPSKPKQFDEFMVEGFRVLLVGVESLAAGRAMGFCEKFVLSGTRVAAIVDESSKIKNHKAIRTKNVIKLGRMTEYRAVLTGTPIANSPLDLYAQYEFLDPDIIGYGDYYSFRARYAIMGGYEGRQIIGYNNLDELVAEVSPYTFQVHTHEVANLLPKTFVQREINMPESLAKLYRNMKKSTGLVQINDDQVVMLQHVLTKATRLHQLAGGQLVTGDVGEYVSTWTHSAKLDELSDITAELGNSSTIIWAAYKPEIAKIAEMLGDNCVQFHGDCTEEERAEAVRRFQAGEVQYFVGNSATGGMGITLNRAETIIYYSSTFSAIDRQQSLERATNVQDGQKSIMVIDLIMQGTVDELVMAALNAKEDLSQYVKTHIDELRNHVL